MLKYLSLAVVFLCAISCAKAESGGAPTLILGTPADPKEWPASVYASMPLGNGATAQCSATVVGEQTLLIASHCVRNGAMAHFSIGPNQYSGVCAHGPGYPSNSTADWTLCYISKKVSGIEYESFLSDATLISVGKQVQLTGYGCTSPGGGGGNDGIFRIGEANVQQMPSGRDYDTVTQGAALCFGDSGGAAYVWDGSDRYIFGVNSRGNIHDTSYLASTYVDVFTNFAKAWATKKATAICGINSNAVGCRTKIKGPIETEFDFDSAIASGHAKMKAGKEMLLTQVKAAILDVLGKIF